MVELCISKWYKILKKSQIKNYNEIKIQTLFIKEYNNLGFEGKSKERQLKLQSLKFQYGDLSDKVLTQLMTAGLPKGTKVGLVLGTEQTIN